MGEIIFGAGFSHSYGVEVVVVLVFVLAFVVVFGDGVTGII
jgi:hypothetical protein